MIAECDQGSRRLVAACFWLMVALYTLTFCAISLRRYDAYLMHALDMGNMEQAIWNTIHGHPFRFTNMRAHLHVEAFGTTTRLSFHVEPMLLPLSVLHLLYPGPQMLLVVQTLVLASGAIPARMMARRHFPGHALAELVFPLAYLLYPAMQAANLYEFHAVTMTAALLFWALAYADQGRTVPFLLFGVAALSCKEEIGVIVALMAVWSIRRGVPWRVALPFAALATAWSLIAVFVIIPAAQRAEHSVVTSSPYLTRYLNRSLTAPGHYEQVTVSEVVRYWLAHPAQLLTTLFGPPKQGFLLRLFAPVGYLALLSPATLAISLPSFALILLSLDQHMYGGLGHYSAEFVGIMSGSAILGLAWAAAVAAHRGHRPERVVTAGCLLLLVLSLSNARLNGFGPFTSGFQWPAITAHVQDANAMLALIPAGASVSAQDDLDPHLSDRADIFLFPDTEGAAYVALDVAANPTPTGPVTEHQMVMAMLRSRLWDVLYANDGLLLLHRRPVQAERVPQLPAAFYSFALHTRATPEHPLRVNAGPGLWMIGYAISRRDTVNLRMPDVVLTTYWQVTARSDRQLVMTTYLTGVNGQLRDNFDQQSATAWLPIDTWQPGQIVQVDSTNMGVGDTVPGTVHACMTIHPPTASVYHLAAWAPLRIVATAPSSGPFYLLGGDQTLCMGAIPVIF